MGKLHNTVVRFRIFSARLDPNLGPFIASAIWCTPETKRYSNVCNITLITHLVRCDCEYYCLLWSDARREVLSIWGSQLSSGSFETLVRIHQTTRRHKPRIIVSGVCHWNLVGGDHNIFSFLIVPKANETSKFHEGTGIYLVTVSILSWNPKFQWRIYDKQPLIFWAGWSRKQTFKWDWI